MNAILEEILRTGHTETVGGQRTRLSSAITFEEGEFLQGLVSEVNPSVTLEIGLAYGISALFICETLKRRGHPEARHIVIDPNQFGGTWGSSWDGIGLNNLKKAGLLDMIEFYNVPSYSALAKLEAAGRKIDFAFIDGWHTFDYTLVDFFFIDKLLRVGGLVVFDDADWSGVGKVCRYVARNRAYSVYKCLRRPFPRFSFSKTSLVHLIEALYRRRAYLRSDFRRYGLLSTSSCIAFRKEAEDSRRWDAHTNF